MFAQQLRPLALFCVLLPIAGCGGKIYDAKGISDGTQLYRDQYAGKIFIEGVSLGGPTPTGAEHRLISTSLNMNGEILAQWVDYRISGTNVPLVFTAAHDATAQALRIEPLERKRQTRETDAAEEVAVHLPPGYLEQHQHGQIDIEIEGRHGNRVVNFGTVYMEGYLAKLSTFQACIKAKTC